MKNSLKFALVAALVSLGCHSKESLNREQQNYQVVQEGSASGATSTVGAPGEGSIAQTAPITGTNADTTTSFTIASNGVPQQAPTSTAPLMPPPNVGAGGAPLNATMPNYPIPPGLARNIGQAGGQTGGSATRSTSRTATSTSARPSASHEATRTAPPAEPAQPMTSAAQPAAHPTDTTASTPPASTETTAPRKSEEKATPAPAPEPAAEPEPAEEPSSQTPPATQTGTFGPH
jgi:hypothetical protein